MKNFLTVRAEAEKNMVFPIEGGAYFSGQENITGRTYARAVIEVPPVTERGARFYVENTEVPPASDGRIVRVNIIRQRAGWYWTGPSIGLVLLSVEQGAKHYYAAKVVFNAPLSLTTFPKAPSEPRLRPTTRGVIDLGEQISSISMRGRTHPVYDRIVVSPKSLLGGGD